MNATRLAVVAGAAGSVGLMLRVGHRNDSTIPLILAVFFTIWVASPFAALLVADRFSKRWSAPVRRRLDAVTLIVTVGSLGIYTYVALSPPKPKPAALFLLVPLGSWLLLAIALLIARFTPGRLPNR